MKPEYDLRASLDRLFLYCESQEWKGYDPYDALNSQLIRLLSCKRRWLRLGFTQLIKKLPFNLRGHLGISRSLNPKAISLFLNGCLILFRISGQERYLQLARQFFRRLKDLSCEGYHGCCWGYSFDWQSRFFFLPKGTPTIVNTAFAANALLNFHQISGLEEGLQMARSCCDFFLQDLHRWETEDQACFSYTPLDALQVYNANILAAQLLNRVHLLHQETLLRDMAQKATNFVIRQQNENGSWFYGNHCSLRWIDGHHTGFILVSLHDIMTKNGWDELRAPLEAGVEYYRRRLFREDGAPKYFPQRRYPADIHGAAQGIISFVRMRAMREDHLAFAEKVARWAIHNMQDQSGYFYYRKGRFLTNKIPYIRWSQAWMFSALTELTSALATEESSP